MQTFRQFLNEMLELETLVKLINKLAAQTPRLWLYCEYDGALHEGVVEEARMNNEWSAIVDYKMWSENEQAFVPATMSIYKEDVGLFYIGKNYDSRRALLCHDKRERTDEERTIYAKKFADAPEWSPELAEHTYQVHGITFSASDGLGSVPGNRNVWHEGIVVMMKPSVFLALASDDEGHQDHTAAELVSLVAKGYAVGIPFLRFIVDEDGNEMPKVVGHEGRGRMKAVMKMVGDKPIPVHMFIGNGLRSNYILNNPEVVDEIKQGLRSQRGGMVRSPVSAVYVSENGRSNQPGIEF